MKSCITIALAIAGLAGSLLFAQGSAEDYGRAAGLRKTTQGKVAGMDFRPVWGPNERRLLFKRVAPGGKYQFMRLDLQSGQQAPAFDHVAMAALLSREFGQKCAADRLPVQNAALGADGRVWLLCRKGAAVRVVKAEPGAELAVTTLDREHPFLLGALPRPTASRDLGPAVHIAFINPTKTPVQLFWIDRKKARRKYGDLQPGATRVQHTFPGHVWLAADANGRAITVFAAGLGDAVAVIGAPPRPPEKKPGSPPHGRPPRQRPAAGPRSPDKRWKAFIRDHNVFLRELATSKEFPLSTDGSAEDAYAGPFFWSPDSTHLAVVQTKPAQKHPVYLIECAPSDQLQPKLHEINYLKPGDRIAHRRPRLFDVAVRKRLPADESLFPTPWAVSHFHWSPDSKRFYFLYNQRGHQVMRVLALDARTGEATAVIEDRSDTFINYSQKTFLYYLDASNEAIWMSERDGWNHLYLVDLASGKVKRRITHGAWVVRGVEAIDLRERQLLLRVLGVHPGQDPYYTQYARVRFDGSDFTLLTQADGTHSIDFSPSGQYYVDTYSRVDLPPVRELRGWADGRLVAELTRADWSELLETGWRSPEPFAAKGRDGKTNIYGVIFRPTTFRPDRQYPVVECIYAGPHGFSVPKSFAPFRGQQELAELGFIVVMIDGMGTNWRSKAFHDVCWKNLADAGFPDRIAWMRAAARRYPCMDLSRVGIYGGSAGGQNAMRALIDHSDFYSAAAADCGCHDNRMDKIWWNEAWMGWPIDEDAYKRSSNAEQAHRLEGHLLLTVGLLDRNVDPASTFQVVQALIKANKDFDLIVFPGKGHGAGGSPYGKRRLFDFFVRHLHGVEPRAGR